MEPTNENIQVCPTCGQSVNIRQIPFYTGMVEALWGVYRWCKEEGRNEFEKKEIKHLISDIESSVFAYWRWWPEGLVYSPDNIKGHYGLDLQKCHEFFSGRLKLPMEIWTNPLTKELTYKNYQTIEGVPHLGNFLDENKNYISQYGEPVQTSLIDDFEEGGENE
jgi:hypothetical protein